MEVKNNKVQMLTNFFIKNGLIIISIITGLIGFFSIFITAYFNSTFYHPEEKTSFKYSFGILEILLTFIAILILILLNKKILKKIPSYFLLALTLIGSFGLYIYWINAIKLNPETHEMALAFLNGNIDYYTSTAQYLFLYPYQFGLTFFVSLIYKIFGENFIYIQYLNAICSITNILLIYYISKILFENNDKVQKILILLLCGFSIYWMFFNVHFYGNILGLTLALFAVLFTLLYLKNNKKIYLLFSGIFIALSILIKSNYNIFLCGILLIFILDNIKKWNLKTLLIIPIFIIGYFSINFGYQQLLKYNNLNLPDGVPMITFVYMGMAEPTDLSPGWYTGDTVKLYKENIYNNEETEKQAINLIKQRLQFFVQNPKDFITFYSIKLSSTWLNPTFQTIWCSLPGTRYRWYPEYAHYLGYHETALSMVGGNLYKIEENYFNIYQIIIFSFASVGLYYTSKNLDLIKALLPIIFIGGFIFHLIWETKAIYVIQYYFLLLPYAAFGLYLLTEKINSLKQKQLKEKN